MKMSHNVEYVKRNFNKALSFCSSGLESGLVERVELEFSTWRKEKTPKILRICILADEIESGKLSFSYNYLFTHKPTPKFQTYTGSIPSPVFSNWIQNKLLISSGLKVDDLLKFELSYESSISL